MTIEQAPKDKPSHKGRHGKWQESKLVARFTSHFNIFRDINEPREGEVTIEEQVKAIERFVRWHERQVSVGRTLLSRIKMHRPEPDDPAALGSAMAGDP